LPHAVRLLEGSGRPVCARLCPQLPDADLRAADELHLRPAADGHRGPGLGGAFRDPRAGGRADRGLRRRAPGARPAVRRRRGQRLRGGRRTDRRHRRLRLQPRRRTAQRRQPAAARRPYRAAARPRDRALVRRVAAGRPALLRLRRQRRARRAGAGRAEGVARRGLCAHRLAEARAREPPRPRPRRRAGLVSALRILVTADAVGGVWTYATDLAAGVAEAEVIIAVFGPAPRPVQRRQGAGLDVVETGLPLDWMARTPREVLAAAARLQRLVAELRPDVVHLNSPALAAAGPLGAPTLGVCHSCVATWWAAVKGGPMPADFRWRTELLRTGLANCDVVVAPSHSFAAALAATYRVPTPVVIHNGRARPAPVEVDREPIVLTVGRLWDEGKNVATLDAAAAACAAPLYAAGPLESPDGASRARLAHARPLGARSADSVAAWMARASIFASAALYEPFGLG